MRTDSGAAGPWPETTDKAKKKDATRVTIETPAGEVVDLTTGELKEAADVESKLLDIMNKIAELQMERDRINIKINDCVADAVRIGISAKAVRMIVAWRKMDDSKLADLTAGLKHLGGVIGLQMEFDF